MIVVVKDEEIQRIGYYAVIPATVLFNERLKPNEKLLYALITALSNKEGYCYASNKYLGEKLGVDPVTVSRWITDLRRNNYVFVDIMRNEKKEIICRRIFPNDVPYRLNNQYPYILKNQEGIDEKVKDNNIIDNNINNNNSINQSYQSIDKIDVMDETAAYMELIRENIDYDILKADMKYRYDLLDELVDIIVDVVAVDREKIRIGGTDYPYQLVKGKFLKLESGHIRYVLDSMEKTTTHIANIRAYLLTALYNAPNTIHNYYSAEVNYFEYGDGKYDV